MVGIGPGVLVPLSPTMMVDVSALLNVMSYVDVTFQGNTIGGTGATGYALQVCAGFTYRPGRH
jgi:hypothetical protein